MIERMSEAEICMDYRQAANPGKQIGILAELNLCGVAEIVEILERNGCKVDKRCLPRKKKQEPFRLAQEPETLEETAETPAEPEPTTEPAPEPEPEPEQEPALEEPRQDASPMTARKLCELLYRVEDDAVILIDGEPIRSCMLRTCPWSEDGEKRPAELDLLSDYGLELLKTRRS